MRKGDIAVVVALSAFALSSPRALQSTAMG